MVKTFIEAYIGKNKHKINVKDIKKLTMLDRPELPKIPSLWHKTETKHSEIHRF